MTPAEYTRLLPWRRIVSRQDFDYEVADVLYQGVALTTECGHRHFYQAYEGLHIPKTKLRCWACGPEGTKESTA